MKTVLYRKDKDGIFRFLCGWKRVAWMVRPQMAFERARAIEYGNGDGVPTGYAAMDVETLGRYTYHAIETDKKKFFLGGFAGKRGKPRFGKLRDAELYKSRNAAETMLRNLRNRNVTGLHITAVCIGEENTLNRRSFAMRLTHKETKAERYLKSFAGGGEIGVADNIDEALRLTYDEFLDAFGIVRERGKDWLLSPMADYGDGLQKAGGQPIDIAVKLCRKRK